MCVKPLKAIDVKGKNTVFMTYKVVPYPEIERILRSGGEAFVEGIDRRTAYSAKIILSKRLKHEVSATKKYYIKRGDKEGEEKYGYVFSCE